jgi:thioredoxin-related protein
MHQRRRFSRVLSLAITLLLFLPVTGNAKSPVDDLMQDDRPLSEPLSLPSWFKLSFLDINEDIRDANRNDRGLILYFGQDNCPYCRALLEHDWGQTDIVTYTRAHFDVVAIDVRGQRMLTGLDNKQYTEKAYAIKLRTNFTPTLLFFDKEGNLALRLAGYRPPYQFRAALEYVADLHHRSEDFAHYLARAEPAFSYGEDKLNRHPAFSRPPLDLSAMLRDSGQPLLVAFERRRCHACDVLHAGPLQDPRILDLLQKLQAVQIDMRAETTLVTPQGIKLSAAQWADRLGLSYAPTLIFYGDDGQEVIRVDSVVGFYRLSGVMQFVVSGGYKRFPTYQLWRQRKQ